jgi:ubiquinone biosynthesis protein UbiJ
MRASKRIGRRRPPGEAALLQHPQQAALELQRHVADLVEEQRAAPGQLELARRAAAVRR